MGSILGRKSRRGFQKSNKINISSFTFYSNMNVPAEVTVEVIKPTNIFLFFTFCKFSEKQGS